MRYNPMILGANARDVVSRVARSCARAKKELGITVHQILCCLCSKPEWSMTVVELAKEFMGEDEGRVVGIDIAAGEAHFSDDSLFAVHHAALQRAHEWDIPATIHAGEDGVSDNVLMAIKEYHAVRIGHGYRLVLDAGQEIPPVHFEACFTSSWSTGSVPNTVDPHPAMVMLRKGASIGLNSDDPTVFGSSISHEYEVAASLGCTMKDFYHMAKCQVEAAFDKTVAQSVRPILDEFYLPRLQAERSRTVVGLPTSSFQ